MHILFDIFALWSISFFAMIFVVGLIVAALAEHEHGGFATIVMAVFLVGLDKLSHVPVWLSMKAHPFAWIVAVLAYLCIGVGWSLLKWGIFCYREKVTALNAYNKWKNSGDSYRLNNRPQARDHKDKIVTWMTYWPLSAVWTFFDDVIGELFNAAFERCEAAFDKISEKAFSKVPKPTVDTK